MGRRFSIATLLLLTTIAALALASMRQATVKMFGSGTVDIRQSIVDGAIAGALYGVALGIWNRRGAAAPLINGAAGLILGVAAGAQMSLEAPWAVLVIAPFVLLAITTLIVQNRRRARPKPNVRL